MNSIKKHTKLIPYLYFISVVIYWFTHINQYNGSTAYLILLLGIPFLWQIIRPNKSLNFVLGITFICISSYAILAFLINFLNLQSVKSTYFVNGFIFVLTNFVMSMWMIRNSLRHSL